MSKFLQETVSKSELASRTHRAKAFHALLDTLPDTPHPELVGKRFAPTANAFECVSMSIHKFRHLQDKLKPVKVQRDHLRRIERDEVDYLYNTSLAHVSFILVVPPGPMRKSAKGVDLELVDGNTRSKLFFVGDRIDVLPDTVSVMVFYPDSEAALKHLYHCVDSGANVKKTRHSVTSFYRSSEVLSNPELLQSALVRDGTFISALRRLAMLHGMATICAKDPNLVDKLEPLVHLYQHELKWLDQFQLKSKGLKSQGLVALVLYLRKRVGASADRDLTDFVNELIRMTRGSQAGVAKEVVSAFVQLGILFPQGFTGETAVDAVLAVGYKTFYTYLGNRALERKPAERRALQAELKNLPPLPDHFVHKLNSATLKARLAA